MGCDVAAPDAPSGRGPAVHLLDAFPSDGCGAADDGCTVSLTSSIVLRFDRFLNPHTANRQAIKVYAGDLETSPSIAYDVVYDPIERVLEYRVPKPRVYLPNTLYQVELLVPDSEIAAGIRAFDGAPLEGGDVPLHFSFVTGDEPTPYVVDTHPACSEVVDHVFGELGACASTACHRPSSPLGGAPYGLWLDNAPNFAQTAIDRVARGTEVGDFSGGTAPIRPERFGVRMPLVEKQNPGNSYVLYKLLVNPANWAGDSGVSTHPLLPLPKRASARPSDEELLRLRDWFVRGDPMPLVGSGIGLAGLRDVSSFIAGEADDCRE